MDKVYLISDFSDKLKRVAENLQIAPNNIISYQFKESESDYHSWLNFVFESKVIDKIIIPVSISNGHPINSDGLILGLHIRLNYELDLNKRLIPIIFLSNFTVENLVKFNSFDSENNPQNLIFTEGVYFSSFDTDDIQKNISMSSPCPEEYYRKNVILKLNINRKESLGGHDIANAWGCFKLAQVIGFEEMVIQNESVAKHLKQLYAKYLICKNETFSKVTINDFEPVKCSEKNILYIDDKADEGWAELMKYLFKGAGEGFRYVDCSKYKADDLHRSFKDFDSFYRECQSNIGEDWDLIIIDLRLNPGKEDIDAELIKPTDFTGYKLIDEFLKHNGGYQIIVLTASNKIWNINAALNRGATSYYIKESPEFNYPIAETKKHLEKFMSDVEICFDRSYLRDFYRKLETIKSIKISTKINEDKIAESNTLLDMAWEQLKSGSLDSLNFGYLTIFQAVEIISDTMFRSDKKSKGFKVGDTYVIKEISDKDREWLLTYKRINSVGYFAPGEITQPKDTKATALYKISCLLYLKCEKDADFLKDFGRLNQLRNDIAHGASKISVSIKDLGDILDILKEVKENL